MPFIFVQLVLRKAIRLFNLIESQTTEGCMGEQASLGFDLTFGDVLLHKLVQAYLFNMLRYTLHIIYQSELIQTQFFNI